MLRLSIIIPMYNVEPYVRRCLESCLAQDLPKDDYEIVVVNDGSKDGSVDIVREMMETATNIRLVERPNGGLSAARNTGLESAKGRYVWFVDSDDWIEPNCIRHLVETAERQSLDVLCFNLQLAYPDSTCTRYLASHEESGKIYDGSHFLCRVGMPAAAWVALYRREFLVDNRLNFMEGILHEDQEFTPRAYFLAQRISFVDDAVYYYNQREGGIMKSSRNRQRSHDLLKVAESLHAFANKHAKVNMEAYDVLMGKVAFAFRQSLAYYDKNYFPIAIYKQSPCYPLVIPRSLPLKERRKYQFINFSISLYKTLYKLLK